MSRWLLLAVLLAAGAAFALRWPKLDQRPMHNDEAVNAIKFGDLWEGKGYKYDPNEHHGPTLIYATWTLGRLSGAPDFAHYTERQLRLVTVLFGVGMVLLLPLFIDGLGRGAVVWAALFTGVSPAFVFYSRYFIHEMLLVFFTLLALGAGWRYWRSRKPVWLLVAGAGLGLVLATKETFVLTLGAAAVAVLLNQTWNRLIDASGPPVKAPPLKWRHIAAGVAVCVVVSALLFSSFLNNPGGLLDFFRTFLPWTRRAAGASPHIHPWYFYLHRLLWFHIAKGPVWTELLIFVLALIGGSAAFMRKGLGDASASLVRFLSFYTFLLTAFYSLLAYKTPWCLLNFWSGAILLAGVGAAVLMRVFRLPAVRWAVGLLILGGAGHLAAQAWHQDTDFAADQRNPYVYAQTSPDLLNLVARVESLAEVHPQHHQMLINVITDEGDCWPLPWYLRQLKRVAWWDRMPAEPYAPVMIVSAALRAGLDEKQTHLMPQYYELRPQVLLELYVQKELWVDWLAKHPPKE